MSDLIEIARDFVHEQLAIRQDTKGVLLVGSVAKNDATEFSDIDLRFILSSEVQYGQRIDTWKDNVYLDGTAESFEHYSSVESILSYPIRANDMNYGQILYDPEGFFADLQYNVHQEFMNPYWISRRVQLIAERITPGFENLQKAILERDTLAICHYAGRLQFQFALIPLIARGISPSSTRHLALLGSIQPELKTIICKLEGSSAMSSDDVLQLTDIIEAWEKLNHKEISHLNKYMLEKAKWMARHGLHKEAVHVLWINVSFKTHPELQSNDPSVKQQAIQLASDWLNSVDWKEQRLSSKLLEVTNLWNAIQSTLTEVNPR